MARLLGTIHGRFDSIGVGTAVTPGNGGSGGEIEEPFPPGVYASDGSADAGLTQFAENIVGLTNPVSFTLSCWFKIPGASTQILFRTSEDGEVFSLDCNVSSVNGSLSITMKDSGLVTRFTYAKAAVFSSGWNHLALSVKIDEASEVSGLSVYANDAVPSSPTITWSSGSNLAFALSGHLMWLFNEKSTNVATTSDGCLAAYWLDINRFTDFSVEATRRKFIDSLGRPVGLGIYGETPFGQRPLLYFDNPFDEWNFNRGTGGDFQYVDVDTYGSNAWTECSDNPATGSLAF